MRKTFIPPHIQPYWRLHVPTEKPPVWKRQWFGNNCACIVFNSLCEVPAL